jgi:hypothetical protein
MSETPGQREAIGRVTQRLVQGGMRPDEAARRAREAAIKADRERDKKR